MGHILIAEDELGLREFLSEALEDDGHRCRQAKHGREALDLLRRQSFDLLITDLRMPEMDGMELLRIARAEQPELEVVLLTAHGSIETAVEAMRLGAFDYLEKPIGSPLELRLLAGRALERRQLKTLATRADREAPQLPPLSYGDPTMERVGEALRKVAATRATVLLTGESGTGKEIAARSVHRWSERANEAFVAVNCGAIPEQLLESELFGHEKGAFTGATKARRGRLELAAGGTFFLDEIGEMRPELQVKLLRVLEQRSFQRVGGERELPADVRWVAATNRNLESRIASGEFREDLYHRLAVFPVELPALRQRRQDILPLAENLLAQIAARLGRGRLELSPEVRQHLTGAPWPGNIRELSNSLERAAILADGTRLEAAHLFWRSQPVAAVSPDPSPPRTLAEIEREAIEAALAAHDDNRRLAAEALGIGLRTLYDKLKRYRPG
ncbi:MAG: sigma-54 dependent transcriptional regulator [Acidobacteriota bacterium]